MFKHILIPTDGSDLSQDAVQYGISLAKAVNAKVTGITVSPPLHIFAMDPAMNRDTPDSYTERMTAVATKFLEQVTNAGQGLVRCDTIHVEHEHPFEAIIETAKTKGCDLIVMASHGRHGIAAIVLGSETLKVLTHSTIPVLVYRESRPTLL
jgi:nucleotide-binding universal stress UspA family protein